MNKKNTTREIVTSGLLLATGLILPMIFHMFGITGQIVLPMHIPVLIGGFLLSPSLALCLGIITPLASSVLTGMPVLFPMAVIMMVELGIYALTASLLSGKMKMKVIPSLIGAMAAGRIAAGLTVAALVALFGVKMNPVLYIKGAVITGIPGIIIQLLIIPSIVYALDKFYELKKNEDY